MVILFNVAWVVALLEMMKIMLLLLIHFISNRISCFTVNMHAAASFNYLFRADSGF